MRRNEEVALLLENIAELLKIKNENPYRIRAYETAAQNIRALEEDIAELAARGKLDEIPGVGQAIAAKIQEYLETGRLQFYEELKREVPIQAVDLLEVPGIGPARAHLLYEKLGITTIQQLLEAAQAHKLCKLPGFGEKLEERIAREAARLMQRTKRLLLGVALPVAEAVVEALRQVPAVREIDPAGSLRRMKETIGDIDILVGSERPQEVVDTFIRLPMVKEVLAVGPTRPSILTREDLQVDLRVVHPDEYGSALLYFTGSKEHNIALRTLVQERGWKLSEYGLFDESGERLASRTEHEIYALLGMDWIPPELRENRGEIQAALAHRLPKLVEQREIRGDLHAHTDWSDGHDSLERMVQAAVARGYEYLVISDHSPSLTVARGLTPERLREQRRLIDELNERYAPFRILQGAEVNIHPDGSLDYPDEVLAELDVVIVSVHSAFDMPSERMTERVVRALSNPHVDILGHPTGRLLNARLPYEIDLDAVLDAAAEYGVAIEVNGQPDRLDLPDIWVQRAIARGIVIACTSDAHSTRQLDNMRWSVATARRGWAEARHVLNTRSHGELVAWLAEHRERRARPLGSRCRTTR
ncbi:MAG: DNA polymerase/3'-5' exonuclease PolX [Thermomicrobium sp.]|nr:DNA polymerase/3'-5' exonuclease PolX [Thermomicrobium sp.]MDW8060509.1 DNA polymerase/3'-5' exonuclease PolX [Thermomicrobium sp.]